MSRNFVSAPPDSGSLHQAALAYLARYAATEAGLRRILARQVERWARAQGDLDAASAAIASARETIETVITRLVQAGALSDVAFAEHRAKRLVQSGQSKRAVQARLIAKGVAPDVAREATAGDADTELAAALVLVRKRRVGPYRPAEMVDTIVHNKELGLLARAGYPRDIAEQALKMSREEAEGRIFALRR